MSELTSKTRLYTLQIFNMMEQFHGEGFSDLPIHEILEMSFHCILRDQYEEEWGSIKLAYSFLMKIIPPEAPFTYKYISSLKTNIKDTEI